MKAAVLPPDLRINWDLRHLATYPVQQGDVAVKDQGIWHIWRFHDDWIPEFVARCEGLARETDVYLSRLATEEDGSARPYLRVMNGGLQP